MICGTFISMYVFGALCESAGPLELSAISREAVWIDLEYGALGVRHQYDESLACGRPPCAEPEMIPLCRAREEDRSMCLTQKEAFCAKPGRRPSVPSPRGGSLYSVQLPNRLVSVRSHYAVAAIARSTSCLRYSLTLFDRLPTLTLPGHLSAWPRPPVTGDQRGIKDQLQKRPYKPWHWWPCG